MDINCQNIKNKEGTIKLYFTWAFFFIRYYIYVTYLDKLGLGLGLDADIHVCLMIFFSSVTGEALLRLPLCKKSFHQSFFLSLQIFQHDP